MKRSVWKWIFWVSLALLVFLTLFTFFMWALGNATAALGAAIMSRTDNDTFAYNGITFGAFLGNFIGSPVFYLYTVNITTLLISAVALIITRKHM